MTNGEKLKEVFPSLQITECDFYIQVMGSNYEFSNTYPKKWWNAEYQEPSSSGKPNRSEIPTSSDCVDRHSVDLLAYRYLKEPTDNHVGFYEDFLDLPSVTPATPIRPKGHWICDGKGRSFADYHCSECGLKLALCGQDIKQRQDSGYSLFCGGCGADMREVEE